MVKEVRASDWYSEIKGRSSQGKEERIKNLLGSILKYVSFDELNNMKPNFQTMYRGNVMKFGETNMKLVEDEEWDDKFTVYDKILKGSISGSKMMTKTVGSDMDKSKAVTQSLIRLMNFSMLKERHLLKQLEREEVASFEKTWMAVAEPRVSNLSSSTINLMKGVMGEVDLPPAVLQEYISGMVANGNPMDVNDTNGWLRVVTCGGVTERTYDDIVRFMRTHSLDVNDDSLVLLMNAALVMDEYSLYERILQEYRDFGYMLSRGLVRSLVQSHAQRGDLNGLLNVVEAAMGRYCFMAGDYEALVAGLCIVGERPLAMDVVDIVVSMRERYESINDVPSAASGGNQVEVVEDPLETKVLDAIMPQQRLVEYLPPLTPRMYKWLLLSANSDIQELSRLVEEVLTVGVKWDLELFEAVVMGLMHCSGGGGGGGAGEVKHHHQTVLAVLAPVVAHLSMDEAGVAVVVAAAHCPELVAVLVECGAVDRNLVPNCGVEQIAISLFSTVKNGK